MATASEEQIVTLEREKSRLEDLLAPDKTWQAYCALEDIGDRQEKSRLAVTLAGNPSFVARNKIVQAIALLDQSGLAPGHGARRPSIAEMIEPLGVTRTHVPEPSAVELPPAPPETARAVPAASELTRILGIDDALASRLAGLGVTRCFEVEAWTAEDVRRIAGALGLGRNISRQNWIEQAAIHAAKLPRVAKLPDAAPVPEPALASELAHKLLQAGTISTDEAEDTSPAPVNSPPPPVAPEYAALAPPAQPPAPLPLTFLRPPLFDFTPERIMPPFVAHTILPDALPQSPASSVVKDMPAPAVAPNSYSGQRPRRAAIAPAVFVSPHFEAAIARDAPGDFDFAEAEADVVIVGRNSVSQAPPPIPAGPEEPAYSTGQADPSRIRSLSRRLLGEKKPRDVDTTPYAPERGAAEEASVEIVRSDKLHRTPPGSSTPRNR